jgi:hypothetical protein
VAVCRKSAARNAIIFDQGGLTPLKKETPRAPRGPSVVCCGDKLGRSPAGREHWWQVHTVIEGMFNLSIPAVLQVSLPDRSWIFS